MTDKGKRTLIDVVKVAAILTLIALIAGALLGVVHHFTIIDENAALAEKLSEIYPSENGYDVISTDIPAIKDSEVLKSGSVIKACKPKDGTNTLVIIAEGKGAYKSTLQIIAVITDYKIKKIESYSNQETPGLGSKAFEEGHLAQYLGKNVKDVVFALGAGPSGVDAVTGATKTSTAVNNAVNCAIVCYNALAPELFGGGQ